MIVRRLKAAMAEPRTRGLDIDDPATTVLRRRIIQEKPFLRRIYEEWYQAIVQEVPRGDGAVLELGCGAGFFGRYLPETITSDVFPWPDVKVVLEAQRLPFADGALRAIVMTDVFHHVSDAQSLLRDAARCVRRGGVLVMVEPWVTPWSRWTLSPSAPRAVRTGCAAVGVSSRGPAFHRERRDAMDHSRT